VPIAVPPWCITLIPLLLALVSLLVDEPSVDSDLPNTPLNDIGWFPLK